MKNLKKLRIAKGLSQQALAEKFHITQQSIYKYENGYAEPDLDTLKKMSIFFGVSIDYLVGNSDTSSTEDMINILSLTADEVKMLQQYRQLDPRLQEAVLSIFTALNK